MIQPLFLMVAAGADAAFLAACDKSLTSVLTVCNVLVPSFMSIALIMTIGRGYLFGNGLAMDWSPLLRALFIFFILFFYKELIDTLSGGIAGMTYAVAPSMSAAEALAQLSPSAATVAATGATTTGQFDVVQNSPSSLTTAWNLITNFGLSGIVTWLFTGTATLLVKTIMEFLQQFIVGFLYICGPIALSLSIIPAFGQLAMKWLQNYMAVQFWGLSFALLDLLYSNFAASAGTGTDGGFLSGLGTAVTNVFTLGTASSGSSTLFAARSCGFILMYIMAPWLTSMFIGSSAVQGFIGSMVGAAASVAGTAAGIAAPPAAGGGASGALGRAMGFGGKSGGGSGGASSGGSDGGSSDSGAASGPPSMTSAPPSNVRTKSSV